MESEYKKEVERRKSSELSNFCCILCSRDDQKYYGISECSHMFCYLCSLRMRWVLKKPICPLCKMNMGILFIVQEKDANYEVLLNNKDKMIKYPTDSVYYYNKNTEIVIDNLISYICQNSKCFLNCTNLSELEKHLRDFHNRFFCQFCLKTKMLFITEHTTYSFSELQNHFENGDKNIGGDIKWHPKCSFCKQRFYDEYHLLSHLSKIHMNCHLCGENKKYIFYNDYEDLVNLN